MDKKRPRWTKYALTPRNTPSPGREQKVAGILRPFPAYFRPFPRKNALNPEAKPNRICGKRKTPSQIKNALLPRFTPSLQGLRPPSLESKKMLFRGCRYRSLYITYLVHPSEASSLWERQGCLRALGREILWRLAREPWGAGLRIPKRSKSQKASRKGAPRRFSCVFLLKSSSFPLSDPFFHVASAEATPAQRPARPAGDAALSVRMRRVSPARGWQRGPRQLQAAPGLGSNSMIALTFSSAKCS